MQLCAVSRWIVQRGADAASGRRIVEFLKCLHPNHLPHGNPMTRFMSLMGVAVLATLVGGCGCRDSSRPGPPAPNAEEAPKLEETMGRNASAKTPAPKYEWPTDFNLPMDNRVEVPEVPEQLQAANPTQDSK
jgi:hypothetical protein